MIGQLGNDPFFGIVLLLMFATLGCFLITMTREHFQIRNEQIKLFLCALGVRFATSIAIYEFGLVKVLGDEDSSGWFNGFLLMNDWNQRQISLFDLPVVLVGAYSGHHTGYSYLVGILFYLTDSPTRLPAAALNCFFGAMTVVLVYRIALTLFSHWGAIRAGWLACFFPSLIIWSSQTLKEPVVIFLESVALYACVHLKVSGFSIRYILLCASAIVLLPPFRFYAAYVAGASALLSLIIPQLSKGKSSIQSALAVGALVVPLIISSGVLARNEANFEKFSQLREIERFRLNVAAGYGSGFQGRYDLNTTSGLLIGTAVGAAHLLLAPFPWQLGGGSLRMVLTAPELLVWWWLVFVGLVPGIWHACRTRFNEIQPMLFFILGLGLLYSMMFGNVGLIFRQRAQLLPWLLILAMVGLEQRAIKKFLKREHLAGSVLVQPRQA